jgi:hypothetical protein
MLTRFTSTAFLKNQGAVNANYLKYQILRWRQLTLIDKKGTTSTGYTDFVNTVQNNTQHTPDYAHDPSRHFVENFTRIVDCKSSSSERGFLGRSAHATVLDMFLVFRDPSKGYVITPDRILNNYYPIPGVSAESDIYILSSKELVWQQEVDRLIKEIDILRNTPRSKGKTAALEQVLKNHLLEGDRGIPHAISVKTTYKERWREANSDATSLRYGSTPRPIQTGLFFMDTERYLTVADRKKVPVSKTIKDAKKRWEDLRGKDNVISLRDPRRMFKYCREIAKG